VERRLQVVAEPQVHCQRRRDAPVVLNEQRIGHLAHLHRRRARLPLSEGRHAEQETRQGVARTVGERCLTRDRRGELEVATVLKEPEHVPIELPGVTPEAHRMLPGAPGDALADLKVVVVVAARRTQKRIANRIVSLNVEPWQTERVRTSETDAGDTELAHQVGSVGRFTKPMQPHPRKAESRLREQRCCRRVHQGNTQILHAIVVKGTEAWQILRCKAGLIAQAVASEQ
jgi:hypothetical protein